ncbi:hypothetical protein [Clostridium sp.]|uniref:hypothetical protein n=1 Tax=Clostridium sp. TaxID=1506 RepID=UPI003D6C9E54
MKNTQLKGIVTCIIILINSIIITIIAMDNGCYGMAFLGIFSSLSSFTIFFLFVGRANCMAKMLNGSDIIAAWQYTERDTINNIKKIKEENKGLFVMAIPVFSLVIIIVALTVGVASGNIGVGLIIFIIVLALNILFFKMYMTTEIKEKNVNIKASDWKKSYVYISTSGIYAHGILSVWKGWGSNLKSVNYDGTKKTLDFTYSYIKPYGFGRYTVNVSVPVDKLYLLDNLKNSFLAYWQE